MATYVTCKNPFKFISRMYSTWPHHKVFTPFPLCFSVVLVNMRNQQTIFSLLSSFLSFSRVLNNRWSWGEYEPLEFDLINGICYLAEWQICTSSCGGGSLDSTHFPWLHYGYFSERVEGCSLSLTEQWQLIHVKDILCRRWNMHLCLKKRGRGEQLYDVLLNLKISLDTIGGSM